MTRSKKSRSKKSRPKKVLVKRGSKRSSRRSPATRSYTRPFRSYRAASAADSADEELLRLVIAKRVKPNTAINVGPPPNNEFAFEENHPGFVPHAQRMGKDREYKAWVQRKQEEAKRERLADEIKLRQRISDITSTSKLIPLYIVGLDASNREDVFEQFDLETIFLWDHIMDPSTRSWNKQKHSIKKEIQQLEQVGEEKVVKYIQETYTI